MGIPERRERERNERREAILAGATRVFAEKGVSLATMEDIARESELSKGALYLYFKSKDELFLAIGHDALRELTERFEEVAVQEFARGIDRVRAMLCSHVDFALANGPRFRVAMSWLGTSYKVDLTSEQFAEYQAEINKVQAMGLAALAAARDDGSLTYDGPLEHLSTLLWGALLGALLVEDNAAEIARRCAQRTPPEGLARLLVDLLLTGLLPRPQNPSEPSSSP